MRSLPPFFFTTRVVLGASTTQIAMELAICFVPARPCFSCEGLPLSGEGEHVAFLLATIGDELRIHDWLGKLLWLG